MEPHVGLSAQQGVSFSLSLCPSPQLVLSLSNKLNPKKY